MGISSSEHLPFYSYNFLTVLAYLDEGELDVRIYFNWVIYSYMFDYFYRIQ